MQSLKNTSGVGQGVLKTSIRGGLALQGELSRSTTFLWHSQLRFVAHSCMEQPFYKCFCQECVSSHEEKKKKLTGLYGGDGGVDGDLQEDLGQGALSGTAAAGVSIPMVSCCQPMPPR